MKIIPNLVQGSAAWHEHRRQKWNASDAPAMLGESPHCTRSELLRRMATGIAPEVDAGAQKRFDKGHAVEALLRARAEEIIGEPLHPFVAVADFDERYSASFDGCTFVGDVTDECKLLNERLRAAFADMETIAPEHRERSAGMCLPIDYRIQQEQQIRIAGAERSLFLTGELRDDGTLGDVFSCWYYPDDALWARIQAGWPQLAADLANFKPTEVTQAPTGHAPESLPALRIEVTGMVTASNLDAFKSHALAVFGSINRTLTTDTEFADAEKTVKWCADVEDRLKAAKQHALSQTESIDALFRTIDEISAEARTVRLDLDKLVKARKEAMRGEIVAGGIAALRSHIAGLNKRLGENYMPPVPADFAGVIKGLKSVASIQDAVDGELARCKIAANETADRIQENMKALVAAGDGAHFPDAATLVLKAPDDCRAVIAQRIAETARLLQAARDREAAQQAAAAKPALPPAAAPAAAPTLVSQGQAANSPSVVPLRAAPASPPTLKLGEINARLQHFATTEAGLAALGFPATKVKGACLYQEADFARMVDSAIAHLRMVQAEQLQAA